MKIGELAELTGVPQRLLRYYEQQELLTPDRMSNGYRDYPEKSVERVKRIRELLDSGVPTRIIKCMLPCLQGGEACPTDEMPAKVRASLEEVLDNLESRIGCLVRTRDSLQTYLDL